MSQLSACASEVQGDPVYSDGVKYYVITKEKMEQEELKLPAAESKMKDFFKKHADIVMSAEQDVPIHKVGVAGATS